MRKGKRDSATIQEQWCLGCSRRFRFRSFIVDKFKSYFGVLLFKGEKERKGEKAKKPTKQNLVPLLSPLHSGLCATRHTFSPQWCLQRCLSLFTVRNKQREKYMFLFQTFAPLFLSLNLTHQPPSFIGFPIFSSYYGLIFLLISISSMLSITNIDSILMNTSLISIFINLCWSESLLLNFQNERKKKKSRVRLVVVSK